MMRFWLLALLASTTILLVRSNKPICNPYDGPPGQSKCVKFHEYDNYQWSTCLSNSYVEVKSAGKHSCLFQQGTYCWYQCQLELFNQESGSVSDKCKCKRGEERAKVPVVPLPTWCYSPTGDSCRWYLDCLEQRFQCSGTDYGYAIEFGTKFCQQYKNNLKSLTPNGKKWARDVGKCLQVALTPYLRDFNANSTCQQIKISAIYSHKCCYLAGGSCRKFGAPSICEISCLDWLRTVWTTKDAFADEFIETVSGLWQSAKECPKDSKSYQCLINLSSYLRYFKINLENKYSSGSQKFGINEIKVGFNYLKSMMKTLASSDHKIEWYFHTDEYDAKDKLLGVNLILMDSNLRFIGNTFSSTNYNSSLDRFITSIMKSLQTEKSSNKGPDDVHIFELVTISQCKDITCEDIVMIVDFLSSTMPPSTTTSLIATTTKAFATKDTTSLKKTTPLTTTPSTTTTPPLTTITTIITPPTPPTTKRPLAVHDLATFISPSIVLIIFMAVMALNKLIF